MNTQIIQLSDLHIGKKGQDTFRRFKAVTDHIARYHEGVPVFITGDITDDGTEKQLEEAYNLLSGLAASNPVLAVPGNHDYAFKGFLPFHSRGTNLQRWYQYLGHPMGFGYRGALPDYWMKAHKNMAFEGYGRFQLDDYTMVFYVDSGDPDRKARCARGWISPMMCEILYDELTRYQSYTRIVFLHHHPFNRAYMTSLEGSKEFMQTLEAAGCEILLFGHKHDYGKWLDGDYRGDYTYDDDDQYIPCVLASHSTMDTLSGHYGAIQVLDIQSVGTKGVEFYPRVEMVDFWSR